jgi:hypothetical protein
MHYKKGDALEAKRRHTSGIALNREFRKIRRVECGQNWTLKIINDNYDYVPVILRRRKNPRWRRVMRLLKEENK